MKTVVIFTLILAFIGISYLWGIRFSSEDIIYRKIPFHKVKDIDCGFWKGMDGIGIGDFLVFSDQCKIVNDTLYFGDDPKAIVIKLIQRDVVGDYIITLKRIPDGEVCEYIAK